MSMSIKNSNEQTDYESSKEQFGAGYHNAKPNAPPIDQQPREYQPLREGDLFNSGESKPTAKHPNSTEGPPEPSGEYSLIGHHSSPGAKGQNHPIGQYAPTGFQGSQQQAVVSQPRANQDGWMNIPAGVPSCPPGLEYLTAINKLLVEQKVEQPEALTGFETKFRMKNHLGQKVFWAVEENDCCTRNMCGPARPSEMKVLDIYKNQVMHMHRPLACSLCCFPCCLQSMEVSAPPGNVIGTIEQEWSICTPQFTIRNNLGDAIFRIEGPLCRFTMCGDVEFKVVSLTGEQIGKIVKQWFNPVHEMFTDTNFFAISFPLDLDVKMKAVLLGACFLIDAMYFETRCNCSCLNMCRCFDDMSANRFCRCFAAFCTCFLQICRCFAFIDNNYNT